MKKGRISAIFLAAVILALCVLAVVRSGSDYGEPFQWYFAGMGLLYAVGLYFLYYLYETFNRK